MLSTEFLAVTVGLVRTGFVQEPKLHAFCVEHWRLCLRNLKQSILGYLKTSEIRESDCGTTEAYSLLPPAG